jgi:tRNA A-37 threonylcarbamoyl transferase component Bud32
MELTFGPLIGDGAFADVFEAHDLLGREFAVKVFRASGSQISSALDHARALVRVRHQNVVSIIALDRQRHPETGEEGDCVVMELLRGNTIGELLQGSPFTATTLREIGLGLLAGLGHIHAQGIAHGDLHEDNVIVVDGTAKIIDILYRDSLALLSTANRETRLRRDILNARVLINDMLSHSELDPGEVTSFNTSLGAGASLPEIHTAFLAVLEPDRATDAERQVDYAFNRVRDPGFVEGEPYARALADETPQLITPALLLRIIDAECVGQKHRKYLTLLWQRLTDAERAPIGVRLGQALEREMPNGNWGPHVLTLCAFGRTGWASLSPALRIRTESVIVNDVLAGHFDIYGTVVGSPGTLGTYCRTLASFFADRDALVNNLSAKLRGNWYGQNYVGRHFMELLPSLADTPARKELLIGGVVSAVRNDAKIVVSELVSLPGDWQAEIARRVDPAPDE